MQCSLKNETRGVVVQIQVSVPDFRIDIACNLQAQGAVRLTGDFRTDPESANIGFGGQVERLGKIIPTS